MTKNSIEEGGIRARPSWDDATDLAQKIASGDTTPLQAVEECIKRIKFFNKPLNAVVSLQEEKAIQEAKTRDFTGLPFGGVPLLLKDLGQNQAGVVSSGGSKLFTKSTSASSDYFVRALEAAGFIIIGRTNVPEFGFKNISDAAIFGPVSNPFRLKCNAGGSSGGAAAAVSSGMVPIAAASDGGGSIRIPASFTSLIGLKPSRGRIPVGPSSFRGWQGASVNFALTTSVRDTRNLLEALQVQQMESPFIMPLLSHEALHARIDRPLRIAYSDQSPVGSLVSDEAKAALRWTIEFLEHLGHSVEKVEPAIDGYDLMKGYYVMNSVETAAMFDEIAQGLGRDLTPDDMELMTWAIYQAGQEILAKDYTKILQDWDYYSAKMAKFHEVYDLYLTPTTADVAPLHGQLGLTPDLEEELKGMADLTVAQGQNLIWRMFEKSLALTPFTQLANITGQPAISLPVYFTEDGLPLGVQFMAAKGREDLLLALAQDFEDHDLILNRWAKE